MEEFNQLLVDGFNEPAFQLVSCDTQKPNLAEMGFFKRGFGSKAIPDELYQHP